MKRIILKSANKRGFTLIEMVVVMFIIAAILSAVLPAIVGAMNNSNVSNSIQSIRSLRTAAEQYYTANGGTYTGGTLGTISIANMAINNMLPAKATGNNSFGGTFSIAPDANANYVDITLTSVPSNVQATLTTDVANLVAVSPTYTAGTKAWTAGF
jgi:prepilin-type N-terminal cleavage/methylation domain-containing protein